MNRSFCSGATAALTLSLLAAPAWADTIKVPSGEIETIQDAVNAASPGDTIAISSGDYFENVVVPPGLDGLTLTGKGKVYLNGFSAPDAPEGNSDGILVQSNGVTISKLTIRHSNSYGIRAFGFVADAGGTVPLEGIRVDKVTFVNNDSGAVNLQVHDAEMLNCNAIGNDGGIDISGDRAKVTKCRIDIVDGIGIEVGDGTDHVVENNRVTSTDGIGIEVDGNNSRVTKNIVDSPCDDGMDIDGDNVLVSSNSVSNVPNDADGIVVDGTAVRIEKNKGSRAQEEGYNLSVSDSFITKNSADQCGGEDECGMRISGNDNEISGNKATNCDTTGIDVAGDDNLVSKNKCSGNTDNGIVVSGGIESTGNVLEGNNVSGNWGDGIENSGSGTVLRKNKVKGNMQDISNRTGAGASIDDQGGNAFSTGGFDVEPIVS